MLREELEKFATKEDIKNFATKKDIKEFVTNDGLRKEFEDFTANQDKKLAKMEARLMLSSLSAIGVATAIVSLVTVYAH